MTQSTINVKDKIPDHPQAIGGEAKAERSAAKQSRSNRLYPALRINLKRRAKKYDEAVQAAAKKDLLTALKRQRDLWYVKDTTLKVLAGPLQPLPEIPNQRALALQKREARRAKQLERQQANDRVREERVKEAQARRPKPNDPRIEVLYGLDIQSNEVETYGAHPLGIDVMHGLVIWQVEAGETKEDRILNLDLIRELEKHPDLVLHVPMHQKTVFLLQRGGRYYESYRDAMGLIIKPIDKVLKRVKNLARLFKLQGRRDDLKIKLLDASSIPDFVMPSDLHHEAEKLLDGFMVVKESILHKLCKSFRARQDCGGKMKTIDRFFVEEAEKCKTFNIRILVKDSGLLKGNCMVISDERMTELYGDVDVVSHSTNMKGEIHGFTGTWIGMDPQSWHDGTRVSLQKAMVFPSLFTEHRIQTLIDAEVKHLVHKVTSGEKLDDLRELVKTLNNHHEESDHIMDSIQMKIAQVQEALGEKSNIYTTSSFCVTEGYNSKVRQMGDPEEMEIRPNWPGSFHMQVISRAMANMCGMDGEVFDVVDGSIAVSSSFGVAVVSDVTWLDMIPVHGGCDQDDKFDLHCVTYQDLKQLLVIRHPCWVGEWSLLKVSHIDFEPKTEMFYQGKMRSMGWMKLDMPVMKPRLNQLLNNRTIIYQQDWMPVVQKPKVPEFTKEWMSTLVIPMLNAGGPGRCINSRAAMANVWSNLAAEKKAKDFTVTLFCSNEQVVDLHQQSVNEEACMLLDAEALNLWEHIRSNRLPIDRALIEHKCPLKALSEHIKSQVKHSDFNMVDGWITRTLKYLKDRIAEGREQLRLWFNENFTEPEWSKKNKSPVPSKYFQSMVDLNKEYQQRDKEYRTQLAEKMRKLRGKKQQKVMAREQYSQQYRELMHELYGRVTTDGVQIVKYFVQIKFNKPTSKKDLEQMDRDRLTIVNDGFLWSENFLPHYYSLIKWGKVSYDKKVEDKPREENPMKVDLSQARISDAQKRHLAKDQYKSDQSTCLLASEGSTGATGEYLRLWQEAKQRVNDPRSGEVCFISANGNRAGRKSPPIEVIKKAAELGCVFMTDSKARRPEGGNPYNTGEQEVAALLRSLDYQEFEEFQGLVCRWKKVPELKKEVEIKKEVEVKKEEPRIVNVQGMTPNDPSVIYCGRAFGGWKESPLHNPIKLNKSCLICSKIHEDTAEGRTECLKCYRYWLWGQLKSGKLVEEIKNIPDDGVLGCWCAPKKCHCEIILKVKQYLILLPKTTSTVSDG